jgi:hypothetical protein
MEKIPIKSSARLAKPSKNALDLTNYLKRVLEKRLKQQ